jgi:hypothetical protein
MKSNLKVIYLLLLGLIYLNSCKENTKEELDATMGYDFFPVETGKCRTYELDTINYNDFNQSIDTFCARIRVCYAGQLLDSTNTPYHIYQVDNPNADWHDSGNRRVGVIQLRNNKMVEYSDTAHLVKMVFPVRERRKWNTNMYNNREPLVGTIINFGKSFDVLNQTFNNTITVQYNDFNSPIAQFTFFEVYAKDVGLIYAENINIIRIDGKVSGRKIIHKLISYE